MHEYRVLTGPTAAGKTALLLDAVPAGGVLVISADSRQVYRHMDIGTGKATAEEQVRLPHRVIDVADPGEDFSAYQFVRQASLALLESRELGLVPWVCGGTGLYIRALVEGLAFGSPPRPRLRAAFNTALKERSARELASEFGLTLAEPDNPVRVLRTAENAAAASDVRGTRIYELLKLDQAALIEDNQQAQMLKLPDDMLAELRHWKCSGVYVFDPGREDLVRRIRARVQSMFSGGLLEEVHQLVALGFGGADVVRDGIAYREAAAVLDGTMELGEAVEQAVIRTRQYAKRQRTYARGQGWKIVESGAIARAIADSVEKGGR